MGSRRMASGHRLVLCDGEKRLFSQDPLATCTGGLRPVSSQRWRHSRPPSPQVQVLHGQDPSPVHGRGTAQRPDLQKEPGPLLLKEKRELRNRLQRVTSFLVLAFFFSKHIIKKINVEKINVWQATSTP